MDAESTAAGRQQVYLLIGVAAARMCSRAAAAA